MFSFLNMKTIIERWPTWCLVLCKKSGVSDHLKFNNKEGYCDPLPFKRRKLNFRGANHWSKVRHSARRVEKGRPGSGVRDIQVPHLSYPQLGLFSVESPSLPYQPTCHPHRVRAQITKPWDKEPFPNTALPCCLVSAAPQRCQLHPRDLPTLTLLGQRHLLGTHLPQGDTGRF